MRAGAGYVTVAAPASLEPDVRGAAARGDDGRRCPTRTARSAARPWRPALRGDRPGRRRRARPGHRAAPRRAQALARALVEPHRRAAGARRRRAQRARRAPRGPAAPAAGRRSSPRTRASWRGCSRSTREEVDRARLHHARAAAARARARRRAQGRRHARRRARRAASRSRAAARPRSPPRARATSSSGVIGGDAGQGPRARARRLRGGLRARARRAGSRPTPHGPDGVIASDVIAALARRALRIGSSARRWR